MSASLPSDLSVASVASVATEKEASRGAAAYDSKLTATAWHRRLFREPTVVWRYVDDDDDDDGGFE